MDLHRFFEAEEQTSSQQSDSSNSTSFLFSLTLKFFLMFFSTFKFFLLCQIHPGSSSSSSSNSEVIREEEEEEESEEKEQVSESDQEDDDDELYYSCEEDIIDRDEVKMVMGKLGLFCSDEGLNESYGSDEISELFEDQEPSLKEVKMAFDVFDENRDGFIDAEELQRVLSALAFKEAAEIDNCQIMINRLDENKDGRIDFNGFVKLMENRFC